MGARRAGPDVRPPAQDASAAHLGGAAVGLIAGVRKRALPPSPSISLHLTHPSHPSEGTTQESPDPFGYQPRAPSLFSWVQVPASAVVEMTYSEVTDEFDVSILVSWRWSTATEGPKPATLTKGYAPMSAAQFQLLQVVYSCGRPPAECGIPSSPSWPFPTTAFARQLVLLVLVLSRGPCLTTVIPAPTSFLAHAQLPPGGSTGLAGVPTHTPSRVSPSVGRHQLHPQGSSTYLLNHPVCRGAAVRSCACGRPPHTTCSTRGWTGVAFPSTPPTRCRRSFARGCTTRAAPTSSSFRRYAVWRTCFPCTRCCCIACTTHCRRRRRRAHSLRGACV